MYSLLSGIIMFHPTKLLSTTQLKSTYRIFTHITVATANNNTKNIAQGTIIAFNSWPCVNAIAIFKDLFSHRIASSTTVRINYKNEFPGKEKLK